MTYCSFCNSELFDKLFSTYSFDTREKEFSLVRCSHCGLVHTEPSPSHSDLALYYAEEYYGEATEKFIKPIEWLVKRGNALRAKSLIKFLPKHNPAETKILDVGCGRANFLKFVSSLGYQAFGVEQEGFRFPKCKEKITFWNGDLKKLPLQNNSFDAISVWHVMEHLTDPKSLIETAQSILKPGGVLVIAVPNYGSFQARLFSKHWFHLDLPRHLFHFNERCLGETLSGFGFEIVCRSTQSWEQNIYGFIQSFLNALFVTGTPNRFYSLIKNSAKTTSLMERIAGLIGFGLFSIILLPLAVLENLMSVSLGKGASLILHARKK